MQMSIVDADASGKTGSQNPVYTDTSTKIRKHINSANSVDRLACTSMISALVDIDGLEDMQKTRIVNQLKSLYSGGSDSTVCAEAVVLYGQLVKKKWPVIMSSIKPELDRCLEWLSAERDLVRQITALRLIQVLCDGASTTMYLYILNILNALKAPLRSHLPEMRETTASTLEIGLDLVLLHDKSVRSMLLDNMYQELLHNHRLGSVEGYHSALLICQAMLLHGSKYMEAHYNHVSEMVLELKEHKNPTVRMAAIGLLPILARFSPKVFAELEIDGKTLMSRACGYLIDVAQRTDKESQAAFLALANIAKSCSPDFLQFLEPTTRSIRNALTMYAKPQPPQTGRYKQVPTAILQTIAILASAMGADLTRHMYGILDLMFVTGLSNELCNSLSALLLNVGQLRPAIQNRLLDMISIILVKVPFRSDEPALDEINQRLDLVSLHHTLPALRTSNSSDSSSDSSNNNVTLDDSEAISIKDIAKDITVTHETLVFALQTLARFDFSEENLPEFVRNAVLRYVGNGSADVRKAAMQSAFQILLSDSMYIQPEGPGTEVASEVVERLIAVAVTDIDPTVRLVAAQTLAQGPSLDFHLGKEQNIKSMLMLVNDEIFEMRLTVISIIGRLTAINPANTVPSIRRISSQLLMELEFANTNSEHEECIQLLMELTNVAERWMKPCVNDIFFAILPRINSSPPRLASKFLDMVAALARVGGSELVPHSNQLLSSIVNVFNSQASGSVCLSALRALGSCASYCGMAIDPYIEYPKLFSILTGILRRQPDDEIRIEVVRVIGALGAIDPHKYKGIADTYTGAQRGGDGSDINGTGAHIHTHTNINAGEGTSNGGTSVSAVAGARSNVPFSFANGVQLNSRQERRKGKAKRARRKRLQVQQGPPPNVVTLLNDDDSPEILSGDIPTNLNGRQFTCEKHYYTEVAIKVLIRILDNTSDTSSDQYAVQALLHMCAPLKASCSPYLPLIIPAILRTMKASPLQMPTFFIQQLTKLVNIAGEFIRPCVDPLFELFDKDSAINDQHKLSLIGLVEALASALYGEFGMHMTSVVQFLVSAMEEDTSESLLVTQNVLGVLVILSPGLESYLQLIIPRLVYMLNPKRASVAIISMCLDCISLIVSVVECSSFASCIILPLVRLLQSKQSQQSLHEPIMHTLCTLMEQLQSDFAMYMPTIDVILKRHSIPPHERYKEYSSLLFSGQLVPVTPSVRVRSSSMGNLPEQSDDISSLHVDVTILQRAWATRNQMTGDDCIRWLNNLFSELLQQSPSSSLRACYNLALKNPKLISELFNVAFVSCWADIPIQNQLELVKSLEGVASNPDVPLEFLQTILDIASFMERDEKKLPIDVKIISSYAGRCHALAKEIRYRETEWTLERNDEAVERLIELNQDLDLDDEAIGLLNYVRKDKPTTKDNVKWCLRLQRWDDALAIYQRQELLNGPSNSNLIGQIRCLFEISDWNALIPIYDRIWRGKDRVLQTQSAEIGVKLAWNVGDIERMEFYLSNLGSTDIATSLDNALLCVHQNRFDDAANYINECREKLGHALDAHRTEFYKQGYSQIFYCQMLSELEEVIAFKLSPYDVERQTALVSTWRQRLGGIQQDSGMWQKLLSIHSMVLRPVMDLDTWISYVNLCRRSGKLNMARNAICQILDDEASYMEEVFRGKASSDQPVDIKTQAQEYMSLKERYVVNRSDMSLNTAIRMSQQPTLVYSYLKYKWAANERHEAFQLLESFIREYSSKTGFDPRNFENFADHTDARRFIATGNDKTAYFLARFYFKHAQWLSIVQQNSSLAQATRGSHLGLDKGDGLHTWRSNVSDSSGTPNNGPASGFGTTINRTDSDTGRTNRSDRLTDDTDILFRVRGEQINELILDSYRAATVLDHKWYKAWHSLALRHYLETQREDSENANVSNKTIDSHVVPAVYGFLRSIQLSRGDTAMQDALRLLTAWFNYSQHGSVVQVVQEGLDLVPMKTWLQVIPQILACIHIKHEGTNRLVRQLLTKIGRAHPQSILFSLYVTARSSHQERNHAAKDVLAKIHIIYPELVEEAEVVSRELVRAACLLPDMWLEALTNASRYYNSYGDKLRALSLLKPLHDRMKALYTPNERRFAQEVGSEVLAAEQFISRYFTAAPHSRDIEWIHKAWGQYAKLQGKLMYMARQVRKLYTWDVAPILLQCRNMHLAVPGSYHPDHEVVQIESFCKEMSVYPTKQRPRLIHICGSNGKKYKFLLKGNEELRQDERAMQLFGLINSLLMYDEVTSHRSLAIERFPVIPLSSDAGLIGFYPNCDDMFNVVKKFREAHKKSVRAEQDMLLQFAPNYQTLTATQQVEAFEYVLSNSCCDDLQWAMWYRSPSAEVWMQERTNYTRSMAVMSMAGYVLGLGDRHLSNIMIHSKSGKVVHIDFGDCFEVAAHRPSTPEKVPFRLTRMTISPMGVNRTEGSFKLTANHMMRVLRANRDSLMAVLEAFVFDPLAVWSFIQDSGDIEDIQTQLQKPQEDGLQTSDLKARAVIKRIQDKLMGRDFNRNVSLSVEEQVDRLVQQAVLSENLAPMYLGWYPFW
ncbi:phosphatidylinositol kinase- protein kinase tor1 [Coemansia sp. RSA 1813]|nr:phosphatidylinositol kinase- protein kinase tor1 [Coemansia sp. RSA 1813]